MNIEEVRRQNKEVMEKYNASQFRKNDIEFKIEVILTGNTFSSMKWFFENKEDAIRFCKEETKKAKKARVIRSEYKKEEKTMYDEVVFEIER